jgi:hypothetical protein
MGKLIVVLLVVFSIVVFGGLSQTEVNILRYQLNMPSVAGNAIGFRVIGSGFDGAFGLVWRWSTNEILFTGQVLGWVGDLFRGDIPWWDRVYYDIFWLLRF